MIDPSQVPLGLVVPVRADRTGRAGPTPRQVRGSAWRRTSQGFYVPAHVDGDDVRQRIVEAAVVVPAGCAVTGWAALRWMGGRWFSGSDGDGRPRPVSIASGTHDLRRQVGIAPSGEGLGPRHVVLHRGIPVTVPTYSVSFEMRYAGDQLRAATVLSMACYSDLVSIEEQTRFLSPGQNGWTGVPLARRAVGLADENLWSPPEQAMFLLWQDGGRHPVPATNAPLFDLVGRHLVTPDLVDVDAGVVGEYNGFHHRDRATYDVDVSRWDLYASYELEVVVMTAADLPDPSRFLRRLGGAYERARGRDPRRRRWTANPPSWWVPTETVAQRRALSFDERRRFLRNRTA